MKHFSQNSLVDNNINKSKYVVIFKTSIKDFAFNKAHTSGSNKHYVVCRMPTVVIGVCFPRRIIEWFYLITYEISTNWVGTFGEHLLDLLNVGLVNVSAAEFMRDIMGAFVSDF